jgi:pimeloyl-ACP methyl ester carboxylesterase
MPVAKLSTGIDLYFECHGHGEPIVFIPGTGFAGNVWVDSQVEELARSHQVIVHDPRGCGRTTHAKGVYTIDLLGNDVVALLEHLGVPHAHVIGHSMGGRIGLSIDAKLSRESQKPGYCRGRVRSSRQRRNRMCTWTAISPRI